MELSELIRSIDIVDYISQYVDLEQKGDEWWGLSCFKDETVPSFSVRRDPPVFFDYSSNKGGGLFNFVQEYNQCSGHEAVEILKKYAGYDGEITKSSPKLDATRTCTKYKRTKKPEKASSGTILPQNYMERYEKRKDKLKIWLDEGISKETLDKFEVFYDAFANRLVFPIRNLDGNIVNVCGRALDKDWKEKGERKYTYYYKWGKLNVIYALYDNLEAIKKAHEIVLFEGCKSVYLANTWGIHNTGAILTSHLSENQMKILIKLGCNVVFALDKEINILEDDVIRRLTSFVKVEYIKDVDDLIEEKDSPVDHGFDVYERLYNNRRRLR